MASKVYKLFEDLLEDELSHFRLKRWKDLLNNMVSLWVLWEFEDVAFERSNDQSELLRHVDSVKHGLDGVSSFLVAADADEVLLYCLQYEQLLRRSAVVEQLLAEVVGVAIDHEVCKVTEYLV